MAAPHMANAATPTTRSDPAALLGSVTRVALSLPAALQLDLIDALASGRDLNPLYAADDIAAAVDKARDEMEPVEREPMDPYEATKAYIASTFAVTL